MTEQDWLDAGFVIEGLGPGMSGWIRNFPNGGFILVTGTGDNECDLPAVDGGFMICLYTPQGWEFGPSISLEIGRNFLPGMILDEVGMKSLLLPILKVLESSVLELPSVLTPA